MLTLPLFLSLRYLLFNKKDKNISLMIKVCFIGILVGTFSLMLTLIITNGFEKTIHEKIQGINAQATIVSPGNKINFENFSEILNKKFPNEIEAISASTLKQIIFEHNGNQTLIMFKGIDPAKESKVTNIESKIISPQKPLSEILEGNKILIGHKVASSWNLKIGDKINILIPESGSISKIYLSKQKVEIAGIFNVGLDEYDSGFAFASLKFLNEVFEEEGADQISLKLKIRKNNLFARFTLLNLEEKFVKNLKESFPLLQIYFWKELYPALVSSLKLEKYVMFIIIALITMVASLNMISLLFIQIQQKKRDIAIFKSMGMLPKNIKMIFLIMGLSITFFGSLLGLILAAIVGFFLEHYPFIELPDVYYVSHLPARMDLELFLLVFACTMLIGFFATWIPAKRASKVNVIDVLRME